MARTIRILPPQLSCYQTQASLEFSQRQGRHRDGHGRLLNSKRHIDKSRIMDTNHLLTPAHVTAVLNYFPSDPHFTRTEHLIFALAYQDDASKIDQLSQYLAGRTLEDCVHHYYCNKFDGRFKNESRKQRYDRLPAYEIDGMLTYPPRNELAMETLPEWDVRLRGAKAKALGDIGGAEYHNNGRLRRKTTTSNPPEDELIHLVGIEIHIAELRKELGIEDEKVFAKTKPLSRWKPAILPRPLHLNLLSDNFRHPFHMSHS